MRIIFMGTPDFAVPSLEKLVEAGYPPVAVVTGPDRPRGRGQQLSPTPVKRAAQTLAIPDILQPESVRDPAFADEIAAREPDVLVVVAFRILPPAVFKTARLGAFNLHGSLLPRYRGAAPIHRAVMAGEEETGVTTFFLREEVDTGNVILRRTMPIGPDDTTGDVHDRMMHLGAEAVVETVRLIERGEAVAIPQDDSRATPAPKVFRDDARIIWDAPAQVVHNHIRGLSPDPGAWSLLDGKTLKIFRTRVASEDVPGEPGALYRVGDRLLVACGEGAVEVRELQIEGKRRVPAADFARGHTLSPETRLA